VILNFQKKKYNGDIILTFVKKYFKPN